MHSLYIGFFPDVVTNLAVVGVTSSSIEISWSPPETDGGNTCRVN